MRARLSAATAQDINDSLTCLQNDDVTKVLVQRERLAIDEDEVGQLNGAQLFVATKSPLNSDSKFFAKSKRV